MGWVFFQMGVKLDPLECWIFFQGVKEGGQTRPPRMLKFFLGGPLGGLGGKLTEL